jgi:hypothetical protein
MAISYASIAAQYPVGFPGERRTRPRLAGAFKGAEDAAYKALRETPKHETRVELSEVLHQISKPDQGKEN